MISSRTFPRAVKHTASPGGESLCYKSGDPLLAPLCHHLASETRNMVSYELKLKNLPNSRNVLLQPADGNTPNLHSICYEISNICLKFP